MPTYRFESVKIRRTRSGECPVCGKSVRRSRTFEHTVNPYNLNPDGAVRTRSEVRDCVRAEADAWTPDFTHERCERGEG